MKLLSTCLIIMAFSFSYLYGDATSIEVPKYDIYSLENTENNQFRVRENFKDLYANKWDKSSAADLFNAVYPAGYYFESGTSTNPPAGYSLLFCDGRSVSRTTYANLFSAIGIQHGQGDGSTTFNIPDCRGRFSRVMDTGAGRDTNASTRSAMNTGGNTGDAIGSVQVSTSIAHNHTDAMEQWSTASSFITGSGYWLSMSGGATAPPASGTTGGSETRPINYNVARFIKY
jgi:microcystin-dependent protein